MKNLFLFLLLFLGVFCQAEVTLVGTASGTPGDNTRPWQTVYPAYALIGSITLEQNAYYRITVAFENVEYEKCNDSVVNPKGTSSWIAVKTSANGQTMLEQGAYSEAWEPFTLQYQNESGDFNVYAAICTYTGGSTVCNNLSEVTAKVTFEKITCPDAALGCKVDTCSICKNTYCTVHDTHTCPCPYSPECVDTNTCPCCGVKVCDTHEYFPCDCKFSECESCALSNECNSTRPAWVVEAERSCTLHQSAISVGRCKFCQKYTFCRYHGTEEHTPCEKICPYTDACSKPLSECDDCHAFYCSKHHAHRTVCGGCNAPNICPNTHKCPTCPNIEGLCNLKVCEKCQQTYCTAHQAVAHIHGGDEGECPNGDDCKKVSCDLCKKVFCLTHTSHTCKKSDPTPTPSPGTGGTGTTSVKLVCPNRADCDIIACDKCGQLYCSTHVTHTCPDTSTGTNVAICPNQPDCEIVVCSECDTTYCATHVPHIQHTCPNLKSCYKATCSKCYEVFCQTHDNHICPDCPYTAFCVRKICATCGELYCTASHATGHTCNSTGNSGTTGGSGTTPGETTGDVIIIGGSGTSGTSGTTDSGTTGGSGTTPGETTDDVIVIGGSGTSGSNGTNGTSGTSGSNGTNGSNGTSSGGTTVLLDLGGSSSLSNSTTTNTVTDSDSDSLTTQKTDNSGVGLAVGAAGVAFGFGNSRPGEIFGQYDAVTPERIQALKDNPQIRNWALYDARKE